MATTQEAEDVVKLFLEAIRGMQRTGITLEIGAALEYADPELLLKDIDKHLSTSGLPNDSIFALEVEAYRKMLRAGVEYRKYFLELRSYEMLKKSAGRA